MSASNQQIERVDPTLAARWLEPWADSLELAMIIDAEQRVLAVNRAFARKFGKPVQAWTGCVLPTLLHPEDAPDWRAAGPRLERPPYHISRDHRWQTAQGWRWISWEETAVRDAEGEVRAVRAIGRDVTKHRLAEEHFCKLAQAVEQAPVSIVMTTPGGLPQYVNSRFTEVTGYTLEDIFEREIPVLREGHVNEAGYRRFCSRVAAGHKWSGELRTERKDGGYVWEFVQVSPIRNAADEIIYLLCLREDITERKVLEDQLRQAQKMESLGTLAGGIAHDFNNIISIVRGFTELSLSLPQNDPRMERYLGAVHDAALRATSLVGQIMAFSRKNEVSYQSVRIDETIRELMDMFGETFPRAIELRQELDTGIEAFAADSNQIRQVIMNLCVNARDAMTEGGVLTVSTRRVAGGGLGLPKADPEQDYACISVSDTGCGMSADVRAHIFEPFFTTRGGRGGTGLGLAVVYGIVTNHNGLVDLESEPGRGTTFHVYLPLRRPAAEVSGSIVGGRDVHVPPGDERVLVVEDEHPILELLGTVLRGAGYQVQTAVDGAEAIERLLGPGPRPDAIVLDLNMPRMGGMDVLKICNQHLPGVPVLVTSGNLTPEVLAELMQLGQPNVLGKPFELTVFGRMLRELLDQRKTG